MADECVPINAWAPLAAAVSQCAETGPCRVYAKLTRVRMVGDDTAGAGGGPQCGVGEWRTLRVLCGWLFWWVWCVSLGLVRLFTCVLPCVLPACVEPCCARCCCSCCAAGVECCCECCCERACYALWFCFSLAANVSRHNLGWHQDPRPSCSGLHRHRVRRPR